MERLPFEPDGTQRLGPEHVALFANQCVAAQARLNPNLVAFPGLQPHLEQRRLLERLECPGTWQIASMPLGSFGCVSFWMSAFLSHTSRSRHVPSDGCGCP